MKICIAFILSLLYYSCNVNSVKNKNTQLLSTYIKTIYDKDSNVQQENLFVDDKVIKQTFFSPNGKKISEYLYSSDEYGIVVFYDSSLSSVSVHPFAIFIDSNRNNKQIPILEFEMQDSLYRIWKKKFDNNLYIMPDGSKKYVTKSNNL